MPSQQIKLGELIQIPTEKKSTSQKKYKNSVKK